MKTRFRGVDYRVIRHRLRRDYGDCDAPSVKRPLIRVSSQAFAQGPLLLDVLLHEALHACFWDCKEEAIRDAAEDIAVYLTALGVECDPERVKERI